MQLTVRAVNRGNLPVHVLRASLGSEQGGCDTENGLFIMDCAGQMDRVLEPGETSPPLATKPSCRSNRGVCLQSPLNPRSARRVVIRVVFATRVQPPLSPTQPHLQPIS